MSACSGVAEPARQVLGISNAKAIPIFASVLNSTSRAASAVHRHHADVECSAITRAGLTSRLGHG